MKLPSASLLLFRLVLLPAQSRTTICRHRHHSCYLCCWIFVPKTCATDKGGNVVQTLHLSYLRSEEQIAFSKMRVPAHLRADRVRRTLIQVVKANQTFQRWRRLLFVHRAVLYRFAHGSEVLLEMSQHWQQWEAYDTW